MKETFTCSSEQETMDVAAKLSQGFHGGEICALRGDLGLGKTTFVKGLARGLNSTTTVTSPTFNLVHRYSGGKLPLVHFDLYRLKHLKEVESLDLENELQGNRVVAIEWPDLVQAILPKSQTYWIEFEETEDLKRQITISKA
jgi:tRNA threonylcarbamoyladenosine biosynthesis protein TsaE